MKRSFLTLAAALLLVSCSSSGSSSVGGSNLMTESVKSAYNGADELMGKTFDKFIMPDTFETAPVDDAYELTVDRTEKELGSDRLKKLFSDFAGEGFDSTTFASLGNNAGYMYGRSGGSVPSSGRFDGHFFMLSNDFLYNENTSQNTEMLWSGYLGLDEDQTFSLGDKQTSASQLAALTDNKLNTFFEGCIEPFEFKTARLTVSSDGDVSVNCGLTFEGIMLQPWMTGLESDIQRGNKNGITKCFAFFGGDADLPDGEHFGYVNTRLLPNLIDKKKLDGIIPLKRAVGILNSELKNTVVYEFCDVRLLYCGTCPAMTFNPDQYYYEQVELRPMWCFFVSAADRGIDHMNCVKVDAVSGDVILDLSSIFLENTQ